MGDEYSTSMRMQQHHADPTAEIRLPERVLAQLRAGIPLISEAAGVVAAAFSVDKPASIVCREVEALLGATRAEQRVRCISQITGALREAVLFENRNATECKVFLQKLASHFVFPLLLHCSVRYLHRALATLIRTVYVMDDILEEHFYEAFMDSHIRCWVSETTGRPTILCHGVTDLLQLKDSVMTWVNCIDSTSCVAIPLFPRVFAATFLDVLPLLRDSLQWMVKNACTRCLQAENGCASSGTLLGEDLSYVRYGIRVVTTYVHKYLHLLEDVWKSEDAARIAMFEDDVCQLIFSALAMLSSPVLPKDVLNGAGLLVSSLLTLRTCNPSLLLEVCRQCSIPMLPSTGSTTTTTEAAGTGSCPSPPPPPPPPVPPPASGSQSNVKMLIQLVYSRDLPVEVSKHREMKSALHSIISAFSDNGRFALLKGLLAHLSTPLHGNVESLGVLLRPAIPLWVETPSTPLVAVHDVIVPVAMAYCAALHAQETRFMAIQTIDSVVRHISSVIMCVVDVLEPLSCGTEEAKARRTTKRRLQRAGANEPTAEAKCRELAVLLCTETTKLARTLSQATDLIIGIWDDSTQQTSGPLYSTYNEILAVCSALKRCAALLPSASLEARAEDVVFDATKTLQSILLIPDERRGKYHALLGLLGVVPVSQFLSGLVRHYSQRSGGDDDFTMSEVQGLCCFSRMLLSTASNPKVGSVAGEVFAKAAGCVLQLKKTDAKGEDLFMEGIIRPLVRSLLVSDFPSPLRLDDAPRISNIVTHMITPCLKSEEVYMPILLSQLMSLLDVEGGFPQVAQSIVEIIHRARVVGRDISAYINPSNHSFRAVLASLQVQTSELRSKALGLCVLSTKKSEPVELWQCRMMEWYISTNMQTGGDSAALQSLLETFKRWTRRLADSYMNQSTKQRRSLKGECKGAEEYKQLVVEHCVRMVQCITPHIGESAKLCRNLSLTRRVTAMTLYMCFLRSVLGFLPEARLHELAEQLFPAVLIEGLLKCLLEGWEKARSSAYNVLLLYCDHAPSALFLPQYLGHPNAAEAIKEEVLRARTYRRAEGEVLRCILATYFTPAAKQAAALEPLEEGRRRVEVAEREMVGLRSKLSDIQALDVKMVCQFIRQTPLHGSLSLCAALLSNAWEVKRDTPAIYGACNTFLLCCSMALQTCSLLVGDGGEQSGADDGSVADVDCRGHIFDKGGSSCAEDDMRSVVNNTWLTIRASAAAVECVIRLAAVENLSFCAVREVCYVLIDSLLRTKHNGVMRAVRQALKTMASALIRSRDVTFHAFPAEMLEFLLGPHGVRSNSVARMLRRSQGLPHAMLALLEAEDPTIPLFIFPRAMNSLLHIAAPGTHSVHAADGGDSNCGSGEKDIARSQRSNALNVLKFIFENKVFASRTVASLEEAFWIATAGFDDPSWGIRNSSLMLFSAVLPRFVGEHPATGGVGVNTSLHDIAVRAPRAVSFAYKELVKSCSSPLPSVGVFPLLQMLSMLIPDPPHLLTKATAAAAAAEMTTETDAGTDSSRIIHAVMRCGSSRNLMVRAASGVALTSLVPPLHLESLLREILSTLNNPQATANAVHGAVLHVQQFHTFYVGTLQWHMRAKSMNSNMTAAMTLLVNRLTIEGFHSVAFSGSKLHRACLHCPTIASAFLSVAADTVYHSLVGDRNRDDSPALFNLIRFGVSVVHGIMCSPTLAYEVAREDHAAVEGNGALFVLLAVQFLSLASDEAGSPVWNAIRDILASRTGESFMSTLMSHISHYTAVQKWSREVSERVVQHLAVKLHCDLSHAALHLLQRSLACESSMRELSCTEVLHVRAHMEYLLTLGSNGDMLLGQHSHMCTAVENLLLRRIDSHARVGLPTTEVQSWAIRLLARFCVWRGAFDEKLMKVLSYYSHSTCNVQHRTAVVEALNDMIHLFQNDGNTAEHRCAFLLMALRLLFDDAHDIRMASCRLVSRFASPEHFSLDHTACLLCVVNHLQQYSTRGVLCLEAVGKYLLCGDTAEDGARTAFLVDQDARDEWDSDNDVAVGEDDDDDDEEEEEEEGADVLFEREAANLFMEKSFLAYLVGVMLPEKNISSPVFAVYDELIRVTAKRGSAVLLYATLFDEKP